MDFNYEVSRSLAACEGAVLVVDASQGVEAQTLANTYLAIDANLEVLPVINKIDLPSARPAEVKAEIEDIIGIPAEDAPEISAKNGINIRAVLERIVADIPAPQGDRNAPLFNFTGQQPHFVKTVQLDVVHQYLAAVQRRDVFVSFQPAQGHEAREQLVRAGVGQRVVGVQAAQSSGNLHIRHCVSSIRS